MRLDEARGVHGRRLSGLLGVEELDVLQVTLVIEPGRHLLGHLGVLLELARLQVGLDHHAGAEAALGDDVSRVGDSVAEDANLGRDVDVVVGGAPEARGAEAVAVEPAPELLAVGEDEQRGSVPSLLHAGIVVVEGLNLRVRGVEIRVVAVRLRDEEHHRLRDGPAGLDEELGDAVEVGGVGGGGVADGSELGLAARPHRVRHVSLSGRHPVEVTLQGVNLAVVAEEPHGLRERPLGDGVGGEAPVVDAELRLKVGVLEILVELAHDGGSKHALVHDCAAGHGADVEVLGDAGHLGVERRGLLLGELSRDEELALEVVLLGAGDEDLLDDGLSRLGHATDDRFVHGHLAPAEDGEALRLDALVEDLAGLFRLRGVLGQEHHADASLALLEAVDALGLAVLPEHLPRDVAHDARAVARVVVRGARAAVLHATERRERVRHGLVRALPLERRDETDAARVSLLEDLVHVDGAAGVGLARRDGDDVTGPGHSRGGVRAKAAEPAMGDGWTRWAGTRWT